MRHRSLLGGVGCLLAVLLLSCVPASVLRNGVPVP